MRIKNRRVLAKNLESRRMLDSSAEFVRDLDLSAPAGWWMDDRPEFASVWLNDELYFAADDGTGDVELWKSNGMSSGTNRVADIRSGHLGSFLWLRKTEGKCS